MLKRPLQRQPWLIWPLASVLALFPLAASTAVHITLSDVAEGRDITVQLIASRVLTYAPCALLIVLLFAWNVRPFPLLRAVMFLAAFAVCSLVGAVALMSGVTWKVVLVAPFFGAFYPGLLAACIWGIERTRRQSGTASTANLLGRHGND